MSRTFLANAEACKSAAPRRLAARHAPLHFASAMSAATDSKSAAAGAAPARLHRSNIFERSFRIVNVMASGVAGSSVISRHPWLCKKMLRRVANASAGSLAGQRQSPSGSTISPGCRLEARHFRQIIQPSAPQSTTPPAMMSGRQCGAAVNQRMAGDSSRIWNGVSRRNSQSKGRSLLCMAAASEEDRPSFLKKSSKKLLLNWLRPFRRGPA